MAGPRGLGRALERGETVFLRRLLPSDEAEYRALLRASLDFHRPWMPRPPAGVDPTGPESFRRALALRRRRNADRMVVCRTADGGLVGAINLTEIVRGPFQSAYVGYWIGAPFARRGTMREALGLALDRAFGPLALHRVEANVRPENEPSIALVKALGFRFEGLARRYLKIAGRWRDHEHWAMLAEDWRAIRRRDEA